MREIEKVLFEKIDRVLIVLNIVLGLVLFAYPASYYFETGDNILLIVGLAISPANIIIALVSKYRFELIERYPYLVNIPALALILYEGDFSPRERGVYINRMFSVILKAGVFLGLYSLVIEYYLIQDVVFKTPFNETYFLMFALATPILLVLGVLVLYANIYREIKIRI